MNRFKYISSRGSWYQSKRLQSSSSNAAIKIPPRIERKPTDILSVLESTIPKDPIVTNYIYHDDPFLLPTKKQHYRTYALSYESGKKTAMWIHKQHGNLFPQNLSDPQIKAFKPPVKYDCKEKASEEILLNAISEYRLSDAVDIYDLLESNVSTTSKQALLELLCFYNDNNIPSKELPNGQWFSRSHRPVWIHNKHINELYEFLTKQDPQTAALAHNAMLSGLAKFYRAQECWNLFEKCEKENIPLNLTSYNYVIAMITEVFGKQSLNEKIDLIYNTLKSMDKKGVKPNVKTLNAALKGATKLPPDLAINIMKHLCKEFKQLNVKLSLASYSYIISILAQKGNQTYNDFMDILREISKEHFTLQDPADVKFFVHAMYFTLNLYHDRTAADMIHSILLTGDNYKLFSDNVTEAAYYSSYMAILLKTSTIQEFFKHYETIVPNTYIPSIRLLSQIVNELRFHEQEVVAKYLARIWSDVILFGYADLSLKLNIISLIEIDALPVDSSLRTTFVDAAWNCWNDIKMEIQNKPETYTPVGTTMTSSLALMLLCDDRINEGVEILTYTIEQPHLFIPTMTKEQLTKLFETCISKECIAGALLILEYTINFGFPHFTEMARKLYNQPQLTNIDRNKLIKLVGKETLDTLDTSKS